MEKKLNDRKVAIIVTDGFEQSEFEKPLQALKEQGASVDVVSLKKGKVKAWNEKNWGDEFEATVAIDSAKSGDYDAPPDWQPADAAGAPMQDAVAQLGAYFAGTLRAFELPLAPAGTPFQREVWAVLQEIPYGTTLSYAGLAERERAGNEQKAHGRHGSSCRRSSPIRGNAVSPRWGDCRIATLIVATWCHEDLHWVSMTGSPIVPDRQRPVPMRGFARDPMRSEA